MNAGFNLISIQYVDNKYNNKMRKDTILLGSVSAIGKVSLYHITAKHSAKTLYVYYRPRRYEMALEYNDLDVSSVLQLAHIMLE